MRDYDFHQLLSPEQFAHLAGDIVELKEDISLRITPKGKDGGIDFHDASYEIMGQVKNYKDSFSQLKSALKEELPKVKKIKPKRYILVTATTCTDKRKQELVALFEGYLTEQDIIDREDLNHLLSKPLYHQIEVSYLNLLVPNITVLMHTIDQVLHKSIYTQTEFELAKIKEEQPFFVTTNVFFDAMERLEQQQAIIISGEPGVGKSMLGRMLCAYLLNQHENTQFVKVTSISELYEMYEKDQNQVYFFDDFWGEIKFNFQITPEEERKLVDFITNITKSDNKWLVVTTREYILKEGLTKNPKTTQDYLSRRFCFELTGLNKKDKFDILYQHVRRSKLSFDQMSYLLHYWNEIVNHQNYTPRIIEIYLSNYQKEEESGQAFYQDFISYLDSPYSYWVESLEKQSFENILLLIMLALEEKQTSLSSLQNHMYEIFQKENIRYSFKENLQVLEDTFLIIKQDEDSFIVQLKNPSYRDFLLSYFGKHYIQYLSYVLPYINTLEKGCLLFESITKEHKEPLVDPHYKALENLLLQHISDLPFYQEDIKISVLSRYAKNLNFKYPSKLATYILNYIKDVSLDLEETLLDYDGNFANFPELIQSVQKSYSLDHYAGKFISFYLIGAYNIDMFYSFLAWENIYPEYFHEYLDENRNLVRKHLEEVALGDASFYQDIGDLSGFDELTDDLYNIKHRIGISCTKKVLDQIDQLYNETELNPEFDTSGIPHSPKKEQEEVPLTEQEKQQIQNQIIHLIGKNQNLQYETLENYLANIQDKKVKYRMNQLFGHYGSSMRSLLWYQKSYDLLEDYFTKHSLSRKEVTLYHGFIEYLKNRSSLSSGELEEIQLLATYFLTKNKVLFTEEDCKEVLKQDYDPHLLSTDFFIQRGEWYHFVHPYIQYFLVFQVYSKTSFMLSLGTLLSLISKHTRKWSKINYYGIDMMDIYHVIKELFPRQWIQVVIPTLESCLDKIDASTPLKLATSFLSIFELQYTYKWDESCYGNYGEAYLYDLIEMYFDMGIADYFDLNGEDNSLQNFLYEFIEKEEVFYVNDYLKKKKFQKLLLENNIVEELNDLYHRMRDFVKEQKEILKKESSKVNE